MKRLLTAAALATVLALTPSSAHASVQPTDMQICNSAASDDWIFPHAVGQPLGNGIGGGGCGTYHNNLGQLRVYIQGESYKYGLSGQGYGACKNGPWDSDPPNSFNGSSVTYRSYWPSNSC